MPTPRKPAQLLALSGAFRKNPGRKRLDIGGNTPLNRRLPRHLPSEYAPAWREIVDRLPAVALYSCDEVPIAVAARLLTDWRATGDIRVARELRSWLGELGFSPRSRMHLSAAPTKLSDGENSFDKYVR